MSAAVILFDIDGTLITCGGAGRRAMELAFAEHLGRTDVANFGFGGMTDRAIIRRSLYNAGHEPTEAVIDAILESYLGHLGALLATWDKFVVLPGVPELLASFAGRASYAVGLGTGNVERGARTKLDRGGLMSHFAFGGFGCDHEERPRLLERGAVRGAERLGARREEVRVVVIGDTPLDVRAARAIGAECIAVCTGSYDAETLRAENPQLLVGDLRAPDVLAYLER